MGVYKLKTGPSYKLKTGPSRFFAVFPQFYSVFGIFRNTNSVTVCQNSVFAKFWVIKNEVFEKKIAFFCFFLFYVGEIETEKRKKRKWKRPKNPIKIGFLRWSSKNVKNQKNGFLAKIA